MNYKGVLYGISMILLILSTVTCQKDDSDPATTDNESSHEAINHAATDNGYSREFDTQAWREIYRNQLNAIVESAMLDVISRGYMDFSEIDIENCGIIRVDRDIFRISSAYVDNRLFVCMEERQGNNVWCMVTDSGRIDEWLKEHIKETLSNYEIYQSLPDDEKRILVAIGYMFRRFTDSQLVDCDANECITAGMIEQKIENMRGEWGIYISANHIGDINLHFSRDAGSNYIIFKLYADGQEFYQWEIFISPDGLQQNEIPSLSGELEIEH